jgi:hypothetical protein
MERDRHRQLNEHTKEVNAGANGTQKYIIKEGPNKGKIADKGQ